MRCVISMWSLILTTVLLLAGVTPAVKTSLWEQQSYSDFEAGKPKDLSFTNTGDVMLSLKIGALTEMKETQVWALVEDSKGNLYAGTGNEGKIYKIDAGGDTDELSYNSPEVTSYSLAVGPDDALYAGTGPDGLVYKITDATTPPTTLLNEGDKYVWALQFDAAGNLASATVSNGEGSSYVIPGTGIVMNNMLGEDDLNPGGFHRWTPDARMTSMMAPTALAWRDGRRVATGGST